MNSHTIYMVVLDLYAICIGLALLCVVIVNKMTEKNCFVVDIKQADVFDLSVITNKNISTQTFYLALIELSNKGYIDIETPSENDLIIKKLKDLPEDDKSYAYLLFVNNDTVHLSDIPVEYFSAVRKGCFHQAKDYSDKWFKSPPMFVKILMPIITLLPLMTYFLLEVYKLSLNTHHSFILKLSAILLFICEGVLASNAGQSPVSAYFKDSIQNTKFKDFCRTGTVFVMLIATILFREPFMFGLLLAFFYIITSYLLKETRTYNYIGMSYEEYIHKIPKATGFFEYYMECYASGKLGFAENKYKQTEIPEKHGFKHVTDTSSYDAYESYFFNILDNMEKEEKKKINIQSKKEKPLSKSFKQVNQV